MSTIVYVANLPEDVRKSEVSAAPGFQGDLFT